MSTAAYRRTPGTPSVAEPMAQEPTVSRVQRFQEAILTYEKATNDFIRTCAEIGADMGSVAMALSERFGSFRFYLAERVTSVRSQLAAGGGR